MTKVKICGLKSMEDIRIVNQYLPDYIGFVFAGTKRKIDKNTAVLLKKNLDKSIQAVGVFVNEAPKNIKVLCQENIIDIVQLHGDEDESYISELRRAISNPIIKAVGVDKDKGIKNLLNYKVDYTLYDTAIKGQYGGNGIAFDHSVLIKPENPFFLAGGLNAHNVVKAIRECSPYCVDVSSGVETDNHKDEIKMKEFIRLVRLS